MKMIEANKVVPLIRLILLDNPNIEKICEGMQDVVNIHTIEAEPVKRGRWIDGMKCSECGQIDWTKPNYCPNCGADMRGEEE